MHEQCSLLWHHAEVFEAAAMPSRGTLAYPVQARLWDDDLDVYLQQFAASC
jgi:hypothetical protein